MIYDCFPFFNELDLLEIRLHILNDIVDKFVIVEATRTHRGVPKPLNFANNRECFTRFMDKITYVVVDDFPNEDEHYINEKGDDWTLENWQRAAIERGLKGIDDNDIIIVSDLDEIPKPSKLRKAISLATAKSVVGLTMDNLNYYFNYRSTEPLANGPRICRFLSYKVFVPNEKINMQCLSGIIPKYQNGANFNRLRATQPNKLICHGAWHFSYLGGLQSLITKASSIVEKSSTNNIPSDPKKIQSIIYAGHDVYGRGYVYRQTRCHGYLPKFILENRNKYHDYFLTLPIIHRIKLDTQYFLFSLGMAVEDLLKRYGFSTDFIHAIRKALY